MRAGLSHDQLGGIWEIIFAVILPQPLSTVAKASLRPGPLPIAAADPGTFAQFTPRRSLVRSQYRPPGKSPDQKLHDRPHPTSGDGALRLLPAGPPAQPVIHLLHTSVRASRCLIAAPV